MCSNSCTVSLACSREFEDSLQRVSDPCLHHKESDTDLVFGILKSIGTAVSEPILYRNPCLAEVILLKHVFVPDDELDNAELIREGEVYGEFKGCILGIVSRVEGTLCDRSLEFRSKERGDNEATIGARTKVSGRSCITSATNVVC